MKIEENKRKHEKQMGFCNYLGLLFSAKENDKNARRNYN